MKNKHIFNALTFSILIGCGALTLSAEEKGQLITEYYNTSGIFAGSSKITRVVCVKNVESSGEDNLSSVDAKYRYCNVDDCSSGGETSVDSRRFTIKNNLGGNWEVVSMSNFSVADPCSGVE